jgi:[acyl-carrier-protein] S-malonyltransferase
VIAIVCPGQGSQTPGFLAPWLEIPAFADAIRAMQSASGVDLLAHGTVSDADTIRDTAIAQPLIVAAGVATLAALADAGADFSKVSGFAGHSVGEITAAVAAGVFTPESGIQFVAKRATEMAKAAALETTSMAAVLGGDPAVVEARLAELDLQPANYNGGGQIVAAGSAEGIAALQAEGPAGARVIPLQVAGAFHTRYMQPAVAALAEYAKGVTVADPTAKLWTNSTGAIVDSGATYLDLLVAQVSNPVRWDLCMESMLAAGVTKIIEVVPAGTLSGLAKRSMPGIEIVAVKTPENLEAALSLINND